jgi:uncharacterized Zn finger protein
MKALELESFERQSEEDAWLADVYENIEREEIEKLLAIQDQVKEALQIADALMLHVNIQQMLPSAIYNLSNRLRDQLERSVDVIGRCL